MFGLGLGLADCSVRPSAAPAPSGPATLNALTLSGNTVLENAAPGVTFGNIQNTTAGSTLSLFNDAGGRVAISGANLLTGLTGFDYETAGSHTITIRETLAGATNTPRDTVLTVNVANLNDTNPTAFTFTPATGAALGSTQTSNTITIAGLGASDNATATLSGDASSLLSKNGGAFVSGPVTVVNGDTLAVRHTASGSGSTAVSTTLAVGTTSATYSSTTVAAAVIGPDTTVSTAWAGDVTHSTFTAVHTVAADTQGTRLVVSTDPTFATGKIYSAYKDTASKTAKHTVSGIAANTDYYFCLEVNGTLKTTKSGSFKTMAQAPGTAHSFRFAWGNCQSGPNTGSVLTTIRNLATKPRFFVHLGDLHYADISTNSESLFDTAIDGVLGGTYSGPFYRQMPTYWMFDDHDFGPNDSDSTSPSRVASLAVIRRRGPNVLGPYTGATDPACYSFVQGRVRFIMLDGRSQRDANGVNGTTQMAWLFGELDAAAAAGQFVIIGHGATVISSGLGAGSASDYGEIGTHAVTTKQAERRSMYDYLKAKGLGRKALFLAGDAHRAQIDDGKAWDYSTTGPAGGGTQIPNVHSGGIYTGGAGVATGSYWSEGVTNHSASIQCMAGVIDITDAGGSTIDVAVNIYGTDNTSTAESIVQSKTFTLGNSALALPTNAVQMAAAGYPSTFLGGWNCTFAAGATAGNQILYIVAIRGTKPASGFTITGWTLVFATPDDTNISVLVYRRTAAGGETTLGVASTVGGRAVSCAMIEIQANAATPLDTSFNDAQDDNAAALSVSMSATTSVANCLGIAIAAQETGGTVGARVWTGGFVEYWRDPSPSPSLSIAMQALGAAGTYSTTMTYGEADERTGLLLCFRP